MALKSVLSELCPRVCQDQDVPSVGVPGQCRVVGNLPQMDLWVSLGLQFRVFQLQILSEGPDRSYSATLLPEVRALKCSAPGPSCGFI